LKINEGRVNLPNPYRCVGVIRHVADLVVGVRGPLVVIGLCICSVTDCLSRRVAEVLGGPVSVPCFMW